MKIRLTRKDLESLSQTQRLSLSKLWLPQKYDVALAYVCIDVTSEEYEKIDFVVGNVDISSSGNITLSAIKDIVEEEPEEEPALQNTTQSSPFPSFNTMSEILYEDAPEEGNSNEIQQADSDEKMEDFTDSFDLPSYFNRDDCVPLLNIGQMLDILSRTGYKNGDFYLSASIDEKSCTLGNDPEFLNEDEGNSELCDVLWEFVKSLL